MEHDDDEWPVTPEQIEAAEQYGRLRLYDFDDFEEEGPYLSSGDEVDFITEFEEEWHAAVGTSFELRDIQVIETSIITFDGFGDDDEHKDWFAKHTGFPNTCVSFIMKMVDGELMGERRHKDSRCQPRKAALYKRSSALAAIQAADELTSE